MKHFSDNIWEFMMKNLFCKKTKIFYDFVIPGKEQKFEEYLPEIRHIRAGIPNPCGWGTGMEDAMINAGVMLDAAIEAYKCGDEKFISLAKDFFSGMKTCASVSESEGFLARSVSPVDGVTHYINSSRDQYTHWIFSAVKYYESGISSEDDKSFIRKTLCAFAKRARQNVKEENSWNLLREDGGRGAVTGMWGALSAHEYMRLPMFFLAAWKIGEDESFEKDYLKFRDEALRLSEDIEPEKYIRPYAINQMQLSLRFVYDYDDDKVFKARCLELMKRNAEYGRNKAIKLSKENTTPENIEKLSYAVKPWNLTPAWYEGDFDGYAYYIPMTYKTLQDASPETAWLIRDVGDAATLYTKLPNSGYDDELMQAIERIACAVNYEKHCSDAPCYLLAPYYELENLNS